jgi:hypothetical protein
MINVYVMTEFFYSFGLSPSSALQVMTPFPPSMSHECSLPLAITGAIQRMEPLNNLQVPEYLELFPFIGINI